MTSSPELCFKTQDHTQSLSRLLFAAKLVTKRFHLFMYCLVVFEVLELDYVAKTRAATITSTIRRRLI